MREGWRYRFAAAIGVGALTGVSVGVANLPTVQHLFTTYTPLFSRLDPITLMGFDLFFATGLTAAIVIAALLPLYRPKPRRTLDTAFEAQRRVVVAIFALATLGYFNYSYRLPRTTLALIGVVLFVTIPAWFVWINKRPGDDIERAVLIGDDPQQFREVLSEDDVPYVGHVCPSLIYGDLPLERAIADGGVPLNRLGGLSKIEDIIVEHDVDTAVLAFREPDRGDFFGTLDTCYAHGIDVKVHRQFADTVLTDGEGGDVLVDVDIEPWDAQDYVFKRVFDVVFSGVGLLLLSPLMLLIAIAIKLDDGGPILYRQERTSGFGSEVPVYKFRSMIEGAEATSGARLSDEDVGGVDPRVTRVGRVLRRTHLDEIPQLWSILMGDMSVVGPRPERPELEHDFVTDGIDWEKRWFVKPGLTGLAQINDITGHDPVKKLRYDLEYIRRQSMILDIKIVLRQIWKVVGEVTGRSTPA